MNKKKLQRELNSKKISLDMYSLDGGLPNEAYCLNKVGNKWEVYYSERGLKTNLKTFDSEEKACDYIYRILVSQ